MRDKLTLDEIYENAFNAANKAAGKQSVSATISFLLSMRIDHLRQQVLAGFKLLETKKISPKKIAGSRWQSEIDKRWQPVTCIVVLQDPSTDTVLLMDDTGLLFTPGNWFPTGISEEGDMDGQAKHLPFEKVIEGLSAHVRTILAKCNSEELSKEIGDEELAQELMALLHTSSTP
jgi:hypothetical protein